MRRVFLIRHGKPDFPDGKRMCLGTTDIPLGTEGLIQAAEAAAKLPEVTAVFSSPLSRAIQTARAIGKPVTVVGDLREMHAGAWDGLTFDEIRMRFPALYAARGSDKSLPLPGGEPEKEALIRFSGAMAQCAAEAPGDFAVVAHGGVISLFLESIGAKRYKPGYAEVLSLVYKNGTFYLQEEL